MGRNGSFKKKLLPLWPCRRLFYGLHLLNLSSIKLGLYAGLRWSNPATKPLCYPSSIAYLVRYISIISISRILSRGYYLLQVYSYNYF